ncbi:MAG: hypothetical protein VKL39_09240 [Leptolyngbyaceae bacterium]|nr:hypothetical protein [Leptolyngbyaceae bacterium]
MANTKKYIDSEHYRQMLVRDGERRFREWHTAYLNYQRDFINKTASTRYLTTSEQDAR